MAEDAPGIGTPTGVAGDVPGPVPGHRVLALVEVMDRLRTACPWDREQTHRTLARYLLEETYEALEAIDSGDTAHLREELGDLLLQVVFHARIAAEAADGFDLDDVAAGITEKLVRRHPHVFADVEVRDADEVNRNWEQIKAREKRRSTPMEGVPRTLPALAYAAAAVARLGHAGRTLEVAGSSVAERLLALVVEAREQGLDPEQELRALVTRLVREEAPAG